MQCRTCGTALPPGATFCPRCGTPAPYNVPRQVEPSSPAAPASPQGGAPPLQPAYNAPPPYTAPPANPYGTPPSQPFSAAQSIPQGAPPQQQPGLPPYPPQGTPPSPYGAPPQYQPGPPAGYAPYPPNPYSPVPQVPPSPQPRDAINLVPTSAEQPGRLEHSAEAVHEKIDVPTPDAHEEHEENANERLILFSDGVIAFAITIAALSIKVSSDTTVFESQLNSIVLKYLGYILSFVIVALSWNEHHRLFHYIKRNDMVLVGLNFAYLASIVVIPIALFFVGIGIADPNNLGNLGIAFLLFLGSQFGASIALLIMWLYASRHHRLLEHEMNPRQVFYTTMRLLFYPALLVVLVVTVFVPLAGLIGLVLLVAALIFRRWYRRGINVTAGQDDIGRILLFSDAVIGIAVTIIAAQIDFSSVTGGGDVQKAFTESLPLLYSYAIGFEVIGVLWLFHYRMFRYINRHSPWLIALNFVFLLFIILMFIPINLYHDYRASEEFFFSFYQTATALVLVVMWWYAARKRRLLDKKMTKEQIRLFSARLVSNLLILFALTVVSFFVPFRPFVYLSVYFAALVLAMLVIHLLGRRARPQQLVARACLRPGFSPRKK